MPGEGGLRRSRLPRTYFPISCAGRESLRRVLGKSKSPKARLGVRPTHRRLSKPFSLRSLNLQLQLPLALFLIPTCMGGGDHEVRIGGETRAEIARQLHNLNNRKGDMGIGEALIRAEDILDLKEQILEEMRALDGSDFWVERGGPLIINRDSKQYSPDKLGQMLIDLRTSGNASESSRILQERKARLDKDVSDATLPARTTFFFPVCRSASKSERTKFSVVMSEFAPICIYLVISPLVSLIPLGVPFPFASNSSTYPEKLSAHECGSDPSGDARSRFDIRFYLVSILFIIPDPEVTFSFPWAVPPNKIDPFGSWSMMAFLLILTIGFLYEWKRGASDRE
ncbi:hypothetical protein HHK36_031414 (mitochondrion) [Tetracentron sinense]|uniref:NADH-ubiquinone oxidoreductase chain 3 n=1 Tax=Tetracentron sinense TaxID=13715 RepID=A0A834Y410_TETSI|nr:hypothetical protein LWB77_mgp09 [Tetracentron sinense]KAF8364964.1 hypothetical protein HHK36_033054 [Tetracentron sinense]KAF8376898.1 hypothetical protein HHK36_031414 [Tetracentron sinense]